MSIEPTLPAAPPALEPRLVSIRDAAAALGISDRSMTTLLDEQLIASVKIGARRLVVVPSLDDYIANLLAYGIEPPAPKRKRGRPRSVPRPAGPGRPWKAPGA